MRYRGNIGSKKSESVKNKERQMEDGTNCEVVGRVAFSN